MLLGVLERLCQGSPAPSLESTQTRVRREGGNKGEEKEEEKEKGKEMEMGEKVTGRRQMNQCNHWALRIPFPVMGSCLIYEVETGHQYYRFDIYLPSLCCRKHHVDAKSKVGKQSSLNG